MKQFLSIILMLVMVLPAIAHRDEENHKMLMAIGADNLMELESYDTIVNHLGYGVRCIGAGPKIDHIGLNLFSDEIKASVDKEMLDFVETALLARILGIETNRSFDYKFYQGEIADIRKVSPDIPCKISNLNSRYLSFEWTLNSAKALRLDVPISYDNFHEGSRSEIEDLLIKKIKETNHRRAPKEENYINRRQSYGDGVSVIPGKSYINPEINQNIYIQEDSIIQPVWAIDYPIESISNLFLFPSRKFEVEDIEVTVLKHEYGEKDTFHTNVENLMAVCEEDGCVPYWGLESFDGRILIGSLFLYNWQHGYDHVLKIECKPDEIINGNGKIKARASLFIPTNNIDTLYEPYRMKTHGEKIKSWKD